MSERSVIVRAVGAVSVVLMSALGVCGQAGSSKELPPELLWSGGAPGAKGSGQADKPTLTTYLPAQNPTHSAVVVAPGGGYTMLAVDHEGVAIARWLNSHGVAAFVLHYRLGPTYHDPVELEDAQRAIRTVRARAESLGIATNRIGMWGFSAGGHLTATAGTLFGDGQPGAADATDRMSSRPDFLILAYPVMTMEGPYTHTGSRTALLGAHPTQVEERRLSPEKHVTAQTPPTFLFSTTDDDAVPVMNSVLFYSALVKAGVPAEMHLFQHGKHGLGLAPNDPVLRVWSDLLLQWMVARGYAAPQS